MSKLSMQELRAAEGGKWFEIEKAAWYAEFNRLMGLYFGNTELDEEERRQVKMDYADGFVPIDVLDNLRFERENRE